MTRSYFEDKIQAAAVSYLRLVLHPAESWRVWSIPNGGLRSKAEAAKLKWTGVLAGVPDIDIGGPDGFRGFIEMKTPDGSLSADQRAFRDWARANGHRWGVARSVDDVRALLAEWRVVTREAASA